MKEMAFQQKLSEMTGPAGKFWLLESALSSRLTNVLRNVNQIAAACSPFEKNRPAMLLTIGPFIRGKIRRELSV